ncbi:tol-pal system YbgF family protein [candidate division KSB1 bacterium]
MKWNKISLTIIFILWIPLFSSASANFSLLLDEGDSLFSKQKYQEAIIAFERVIFNGCNTETFAEVLIRKSACYKQMGAYEKALHELFRINFNDFDSPVKNKFLYELSLCFYLNNNIESSLAYFQQVSDNKNDKLKMDISFLGMLLMNDLYNWNIAKGYARDYIQLKETDPVVADSLISIINNMYNSKNIPKLKKGKTARTLSFIIPGLGQTYAGYPFDGLLNFALCVGTMYVGGMFFQCGMYFTGIVGGVGLFIKFYYGGLERTTYLVNERNSINADQFNNVIEDFMFNL